MIVLAFVALPLVVMAAARFRPEGLPPQTAIVLNALFPGAGLALLEAPLSEVVISVVLGEAGMFIWWVGNTAVPLFLIGIASAVWAAARSARIPVPAYPASDVELNRNVVEAPQKSAETRPYLKPPNPSLHAEDDECLGEAGYTVTVRCTECGADVEVPVLHNMAHCEFCGTNHLVVGHSSVLQLTIPDKIGGRDSLRDAILDHYRYTHYVELYQKHVAPLERRATFAAEGQLMDASEVAAAAELAERRISVRADDYRKKLAAELEVNVVERFLAPYWHGMGTLFQAAFGRSPRDQEKELEFALASVEASAPAFEDVELPAMGHLSYLRSLLPAAVRAETRVVPSSRPPTVLKEGFGDLDRKKIVREIDVIGHGNLFSSDATATVWRPWWIARVRGAGLSGTLLVDGGTREVEGPAPSIPDETLQPMPDEARTAGNLRFLPMECPVCGDEFVFRPDAIVHFCTNCHRAIGVEDGRKVEVPYDRGQFSGPPAVDILPFWRFPLRLRTGDGKLLTDLAHLTDGIDGTLDQIGEDAPTTQEDILIPAFHVINPKLMTLALKRLFHFTAATSWTISEGRYPLDTDVAPNPVTLHESRARRLTPYYLANAFGRRDLARVTIHEVTPWLFKSRLESAGRLTYLPVPRPILEPFLGYIGRFRVPGLHGRPAQRTAVPGGTSPSGDRR